MTARNDAHSAQQPTRNHHRREARFREGAGFAASGAAAEAPGRHPAAEAALEPEGDGHGQVVVAVGGGDLETAGDAARPEAQGNLGGRDLHRVEQRRIVPSKALSERRLGSAHNAFSAESAPRGRCRLEGNFRVRSELGVDLTSVLAASEAGGGLFAVNHPVLNLGNLCLGCAWVLGTPPGDIDPVEVQNGAYSLMGTLLYSDALAFWDAILDAGGRAAATGGIDDHRAGIDLDALQSPIGSATTLVYADALSVEAILASVRAGRTVVKLEGPNDPMVELFAGDVTLGDTVDGPVTLRAVVTGATSGRLAFVRNGELARHVDVTSDPFEATLEVDPPYGDVDDRWRAQLSMPRPRVVTSHLWGRATGGPPHAGAGPGGGCGCRTAGGESGAWRWPGRAGAGEPPSGAAVGPVARPAPHRQGSKTDTVVPTPTRSVTRIVPSLGVLGRKSMVSFVPTSA